jgi:hypothetical protein
MRRVIAALGVVSLLFVGGTAMRADAGKGNKNNQCQDGQDNDKDGLVDTADPDCASPADPHEGPEVPIKGAP